MWRILLSIFLIFSLSIVPASLSFSDVGPNSKAKVTLSEFQGCLEDLEACNKGYQKLEDNLHECVVKVDRPKLFWIFDAETVAWIAVAFVAGKVF